jgi:hypothetical protein
LLPFYITKTLLFYNKPMFQKAACPAAQISIPHRAAQKMVCICLGLSHSTRLALPAAYATNGIDLLRDDQPTFNTPRRSGHRL